MQGEVWTLKSYKNWTFSPEILNLEQGIGWNLYQKIQNKERLKYIKICLSNESSLEIEEWA